MTTTATDPFAAFSVKELTSIYNKLADQTEDHKRVKKHASAAKAKEAVEQLLALTGDRIVLLTQPDYKKRGSGADRFPLYKNGQLASEYVAKCEAAGFDSETAKRDLRYDCQRGLIELISV